MSWLFGQHQLSQNSRGVIATVGNFDGVHRGHQALLAQLRARSIAQGLASVVILFEPQPAEYLYPERAPARLATLREKLALITSFKIDTVLCLRFNAGLAEMEAEAFAKRYLFATEKIRSLLIGSDFRFGRRRAGDIPLLQTLAAAQNVEVALFDEVLIEGERVSSTSVRAALAAADFRRVERLLGRAYSVCGRVVRGAGLGRQWGVPTANILLGRRQVALRGVFFVRVQRASGEWLEGVANLGYRPTVDGMKASLEVHLLQSNASLYGERLQVFFLHKLRDEVKFNSLEALFAQIHRDIHAAQLFSESMTLPAFH